MRFFSNFLYKSICCGYSFELHPQVDAIQMGTYNTCLYTEIDKKYFSSNLKTTELLDCVLIGVCAVIRVNTVGVNITLSGELQLLGPSCIRLNRKLKPKFIGHWTRLHLYLYPKYLDRQQQRSLCYVYCLYLI